MSNILMDAAEYQHEQRLKRETAVVALLSPIFLKQSKKHKDFIRKVYQELASGGTIQREELYKYGRDKKIKNELIQIFKDTGSEEYEVVRRSLEEETNNSYLYALFMLDTLGLTVKNKKALSKKQLKEIMDERWSGLNVKEIIEKNIAEQTGKAFNELVLAATMKKEMKEVVVSAEKQAERAKNAAMVLFVTETTRKVSLGSRIAYAESPSVKEEQFIAVLDRRTTRICSSLDRKVYKVGQAPQPPLHVNCRSQVMPYFKNPMKYSKVVIDPSTGKNYLIDDNRYEEWRNSIEY